MKMKAMFLACAALAAAARGADGDWLTWGGVLAGSGMTGTRTTMLGAAAGGGAQGADRCVFIGGGAGAYSTNLTRCVAIGHGAMARTASLNGATWLNGQFFASAQGNGFWIKANPGTPDTNAPIYYADGVLNLNATVRLNGGEISGGGASGGDSDASLPGYDLYVDSAGGDDLFSGASPTSAKRTLDAAVSLVSSNGTSICLLPGVYSSPTGAYATKGEYPAHRVRFVAPHGPEKTTITGGGERFFTGSSNAFTSVEGCTLTGFKVARNTQPAFFGLHFTNCTFTGEVWQSLPEKAPTFRSCLFDDCRVDLARRVESDAASSNSGSAFLSACEAERTVFNVTSTNAPKLLLCGSALRDCYIYAEGVSRLAVSTAQGTALGGAMSLTDCTVVCPSQADIGAAGRIPATGCLIGVGTNGAAVAWSGLENSVITNAAAVAEAVGADFRPAVTNWRYRFHGYGSAAERAFRDSVLESIRSALDSAAAN